MPGASLRDRAVPFHELVNAMTILALSTDGSKTIEDSTFRLVQIWKP